MAYSDICINMKRMLTHTFVWDTSNENYFLW